MSGLGTTLEERRKDEQKNQQPETAMKFSDMVDEMDFDKVSFKSDEEVDEYESKKEQERIADTIRKLGIPTKWSMERFEQRYWPEGYKAVQEFISQKGKQAKNLLLAGQSGTGKSWLACATMIELVKMNVNLMRLNEVTLHQLWFRSMRSKTPVFWETIEKAKNTRVLVFEELGKHKLTEDTEGIYLSSFGDIPYEILNYRYENDKVTIVTTQHDSKESIMRLVGKSIYRRVLRQEGDNINCIYAMKGGQK